MNMNKNLKIFSIAIIVILSIGAGYFFTNEEKSKEDIVIRILDRPTDHYNWQIVKKLTGRDIFEEEGVKLESITSVQSSGGTVSIQALLAGNIDYAGGAWPVWINAIAAGGKIKAVVIHSSSAPTTKNNPGDNLIVLENSSIYTVKDFVGKKLAINVLGAEADYLIRQMLKQNGLTIDQVQLVPVPSAQIEQVLRSNQVDVARLSEENYEIAKERGGLREILGTRSYDIKGENIGGVAGFREDFIKDHPETIKRFVTAYEKSQRLVWDEYQKDPERVKKAVAEVFTEKGGNPKIAKYFTPKWTPDYPFATDKDVQWWLDIFESEGKLKPGQIKPSDVYTNEFNPFYKEYIQKKGGT